MAIFPLKSLEELTYEGLCQLKFQLEQELERREDVQNEIDPDELPE